jgi:hypothetical protein
MHTRVDPTYDGPPAAAENLLNLLLSDVDREPVLGDFAEEFRARGGALQGDLWYWFAVLRSAPALLYLNLKQSLTWRTIMDNLSLTKRDNRWAVAGFAFLLPAALLLTGGVLFSLGIPALNNLYDRLGLMNTFFHPAVIIGGILFALGSNVFRVFGFDLRKEDGSLVSTVVIRGKALNLALVGLCALLAAAILLYGFVENYALVMTHP